MAFYFKFSALKLTWFQIFIIFESSSDKNDFLGIDFFFCFIIIYLRQKQCDILKLDMNFFSHVNLILISITRKLVDSVINLLIHKTISFSKGIKGNQKRRFINFLEYKSHPSKCFVM